MVLNITVSDNYKAVFEFDLAREYKVSRKWRMGQCSGIHEYTFNKRMMYIERCCVNPGEHILSCHDEEKKVKMGWGNASIEINGQTYCDNYVGEKWIEKGINIIYLG